MMRKKQISRMLIGALTVCLVTACSNETDVLTGLRTDGNTLSVNLQTTDVGVTTRTQIASDGESNVESLSAYLFDNDEGRGYQLEKVYNNLTWNENDPAHTVALTGIAKRGPKKVYFVANGGSITALGNVGTGISETDFKALLMNEMKENPATPLTMTAEAELAEWIEGANNVTIQKTVQLKRVSARIDLVVAPQAGLTFTVKDIKMKSRANSYLFPNDAPYIVEGVVELTGTAGEGSTDADGNTAYTSLLYPYETPGGVVTEVEVSGNVQAGEVTKEVTFAVPFTNETYADGIPIERNHRYTVQIARIDGFYSAEATITVSDWSTGEASGNLLAGEELKMTATEEINRQLSAESTVTAVYPTDDSKTATVELAADDAKIYKIYVGSANIEAVTSWGELPGGWTIAEPAATRTEYLWEKSYWTLTVPANETDVVKSVTIKAVNKLEKDDTDKFVQITFTQAGKEEVVDHSKNPLLKWAKTDLVYNKNSKTSNFASGYTEQGSLYQWGRNTGWKDYKDALGTYDSFNVTYGYGTYNKSYKTGTGLYNGDDHQSQRYTSIEQIKNNPSKYFMDANGTDYWASSFGDGGSTWQGRAEKCGFANSVCPDNWRMPTKADFLEIKPVDPFSGSSSLASVLNNHVELRTNGDCSYAIRWSAEAISSKTYLRIDAIVVSGNFTKEELSRVDWASDEVVTRYFGANGFIHGFYHINKVQNGPQVDDFPVARPMPGTETHEDVLKSNNYYYTVTYDYIKDYSVNNEGYYWMSDAKEAFTFQDNTRVKNAQKTTNNSPNGQYPFSNRQSVLGILPINAQDCCAIRCVTDNPDLQQK